MFINKYATKFFMFFMQSYKYLNLKLNLIVLVWLK